MRRFSCGVVSQGGGDAFGSETVPIRIVGSGHAFVGQRIVEQTVGFADNRRVAYAPTPNLLHGKGMLGMSLPMNFDDLRIGDCLVALLVTGSTLNLQSFMGAAREMRDGRFDWVGELEPASRLVSAFAPAAGTTRGADNQ